MSRHNKDRRQGGKPPTLLYRRPPGAKKLAPGVYVIDGTLTVMAPELLVHLGIEDTLENRDEAVRVAQRVFREKFGYLASEVRGVCPRCCGTGVEGGDKAVCTYCRGRRDVVLEVEQPFG